ncbi:MULTISPECIES: pantetheine-phosphate adenylyltransferase [Clostridium]|jgi:pantetheine-phosphate adenylyltransferase|uniref:Phosphopantetheine adenylyltransferase n=6 Tax=Clostridium TaxID=1485 RepID=A0A168L6P2_9CLOT|nr:MULTISPECIES: pantetheine-phosphate adenylyltransferase [Clostridium]ADK14340.1 phosphopantetheine adenylyltransferase [Clostridium ljungdahlii DSM 13528]AGY77556.1 pantetheine-phosphate adenylyltransferase [Clostridium autoethanogenum DSM 10061]ALU37697.1 Phosphopantetheine adenylyltransferase [Clostridium autoethanogenum DSM 10061]AZV56266.1 pantetheine-phosphate adenylyltransferase [Clostridium sp. AWRP]OAA82735.1 Phosphopantetheine adenylyltransferase [Clostridium ljungdahlii]
MKTAVYPGSFDPITNGHLDIINRASKVFDHLIVGVLINPEKQGLFNIEERVKLIQKVVKDIPNVKVESFSGLLIDFMKKNDIQVIVKGLRAVSDFEYEFQMSLMNKKLDSDKETVFMMTSAMNSYLSSSSVKQVAMFGGCIKGLVPEEIRFDIINKINRVYKKC